MNLFNFIIKIKNDVSWYLLKIGHNFYKYTINEKILSLDMPKEIRNAVAITSTPLNNVLAFLSSDYCIKHLNYNTQKITEVADVPRSTKNIIRAGNKILLTTDNSICYLDDYPPITTSINTKKILNDDNMLYILSEDDNLYTYDLKKKEESLIYEDVVDFDVNDRYIFVLRYESIIIRNIQNPLHVRLLNNNNYKKIKAINENQFIVLNEKELKVFDNFGVITTTINGITINNIKSNMVTIDDAIFFINNENAISKIEVMQNYDILYSVINIYGR